MSIQTYVTGWITTNFLKRVLPIAIIVFLMYQCNRGCNSKPEFADSSVFDYTAIALSLPVKDSIPVDTIAANQDLQDIIPGEMIEFAKAHSGLFTRYLSGKYKVENGYIIKTE